MGGTAMEKKVKYIIAIILLLIISSAICSCKTKYVTVPEYHSDTVRVSEHDTIIVKQHSESVSVPLPTVYLSNVTKDTVSILKDGLYKSVASIKDGLLHHNLYTLPKAKVYTDVRASDTLKIHNIKTDNVKIDSIPKPYPVVKEKIVYELHWWQKIPYYIGIVAIIAILVYVIMWAIKKGLIHL